MSAPAHAASDISVIVCTRNRRDALARLLDRCTALEVPAGARWELIVVDNGSTDGTAAMLASWTSVLPMRVVTEPTVGLSRARNAGIAAATGDLVMFTDDDCLPDLRWLVTIAGEFARTPELAVLGGRVELYDSRDRPPTTRTSRERARITTTSRPDLIIGCNMAFRRSVVAAIGGFDLALGSGTGAPAGEDIDFVYRAIRAAMRIEYVPDALVYHNHGRRTDAQIRALNRAYTVARGAILCKYLLARDRGTLRRIRDDLSWQARAAASDLLAARFPGRVVRHYWQIAIGAGYWLRHGASAHRAR